MKPPLLSAGGREALSFIPVNLRRNPLLVPFLIKENSVSERLRTGSRSLTLKRVCTQPYLIFKAWAFNVFML